MNEKKNCSTYYKKAQRKSMLRELLMTFLGATLSIVLTFGTSYLLEKQQQKKDGRQTAMMVIHDIDNSVAALREMTTRDEKAFILSQYVMNHIETLDNIGEDTLVSVLNYLTSAGDDQLSLDDSSERIFLSSQDAWKNINNATFIDVVQKFYYERHATYNYINNDKMWRSPLDEEEVLKHALEREYLSIDYANLLKEAFKRENVRLFIAASPNRQRQLNDVADRFQSTSDQCKFIMGITDEELKEYVENRERTGEPLKKHELYGKWIVQSTSETYIEFKFKENDSVVIQQIEHMSDSHYSGRANLCYTYRGTWQLQGDSLITILNPVFEFVLDTTGISYLPEMNESVAYIIDQWKKTHKEYQAQRAGREPIRRAYAAFVDASGKKIELTWITTDEDGKEEKEKYYLSPEK